MVEVILINTASIAFTAALVVGVVAGVRKAKDMRKEKTEMVGSASSSTRGLDVDMVGLDAVGLDMA